jgi:hypothetical protein
MSSLSPQAVRVFCRVRPFLASEIEQHGALVVDVGGNGQTVLAGDSFPASLLWSVDEFSGPTTEQAERLPQTDRYASQAAVYDRAVSGCVSDAIDRGVSAAVVALGAPATGKSFTFRGEAGERGLVARAISGVFRRIGEDSSKSVFTVSVSAYEVYNDEVVDLLKDDSSTAGGRRAAAAGAGGAPATPRARFNVVLGEVEVLGVGEHPVASEAAAAGLLSRAFARAHVTPSVRSAASSRSHVVVSIKITRRRAEEGGAGAELSSRSRLDFFDLAASASFADFPATAAAATEAKSINRSISALRKVVGALTEHPAPSPATPPPAAAASASSPAAAKPKGALAPFRDSTLTVLLQDCLKGSSTLTVIGFVSPSGTRLEESVSTLRLLTELSGITNHPRARIARIEDSSKAGSKSARPSTAPPAVARPLHQPKPARPGTASAAAKSPSPSPDAASPGPASSPPKRPSVTLSPERRAERLVQAQLDKVEAKRQAALKAQIAQLTRNLAVLESTRAKPVSFKVVMQTPRGEMRVCIDEPVATDKDRAFVKRRLEEALAKAQAAQTQRKD